MLLVPYSSIILTMLLRRPVRIEAIAITVATPMTMPRTVRKLRNLWARTVPSAMTIVSVGSHFGSLILFLSVLAQCHDRIQSRRFVRRINTEDHSDAA